MPQMDENLSSQQIYRTLLTRIVRQEYRAGSWLREDAIGKEFDASRTPVRSALAQLSADGLVETIPKRGSRVAGFTVDDLEECFEIRRVLELLALERGLPNLRIAALSELRDQIEDARDGSDAIVHADIDTRFHQVIIESANSTRLSNQLASLYRIMHAFRELGFANAEIRSWASEEHLELIDAMAARDLERSRTLLGDHIAKSKSRILAQVLRSGL